MDGAEGQEDESKAQGPRDGPAARLQDQAEAWQAQAMVQSMQHALAMVNTLVDSRDHWRNSYSTLYAASLNQKILDDTEILHLTKQVASMRKQLTSYGIPILLVSSDEEQSNGE